MGLAELIRKYSGPGPRYTSYPTAPQWTEEIGAASYRDLLLSDFPAKEKPMGVYIHLPFCESLCYYCGCNIQISSDKSRSRQYVDRVTEEIRRVSLLMGGHRSLNLISWGGGTPTFLSLEEIEKLHEITASHFKIVDDAEISIEIDPRVTSFEQLSLLRRLGFNRVSLGVQDTDPKVQKAIHREQGLDEIREMMRECRKLGFKGINLDFIYGLPHQTIESFQKTIDSILDLRPDRIALYNYAHLPAMIPHQKILETLPMPSASLRVEIYSMAFDRLVTAGYQAIGMDHFALATDELALAADRGGLHRNFMGYTVMRGESLLGFGASAIGEVGGYYFQNIRSPKSYEEVILDGALATFRGCRLSGEDRIRKWLIESILCDFRVDFAEYSSRFGRDFQKEYISQSDRLRGFESDQLVSLSERDLKVTPLGRLFVRNVAMVFDEYLQGKSQPFSQTV